MFLRWRGFNIDSGLFSITFNPPQNFASYREAELDTSRVNTFQALDQVPYFSKRFLLKRYLGLSEQEISENEQMWKEERTKAEPPAPQGSDLRSVGITPAGLEADITAGQEFGQMSPEGELAGAPPGAVGPGQQPAAGASTPTISGPGGAPAVAPAG